MSVTPIAYSCKRSSSHSSTHKALGFEKKQLEESGLGPHGSSSDICTQHSPLHRKDRC